MSYLQDYYTVHGPDAVFAAKEIFKTMGVVKYLGQGKTNIHVVSSFHLHFVWCKSYYVGLAFRKYLLKIPYGSPGFNRLFCRKTN